MGIRYADNAIADFKEAFAISPDNAECCLECGYTIIENFNSKNYKEDEKQNAAKEALEYLRKAAENGTDNTSEYNEYYLKALEVMDNDEIKKNGIGTYIEKALTFSKLESDQELEDKIGHSNARQYLTNLEELLEYDDEGINAVLEDYKTSADKPDASAENLYNYACVLRLCKRYEEAFSYIERVIELDPLFAPAYEQRGMICAYRGDNDSALDDIDIAIKLCDTRDLHVYRANILYNEERYDEAIEDYKIAVQFDSNRTAYCYYSIGQSYYRIDKYSEASQYYQLAIKDGLVDDLKPYCYREWGDVNYLMGKEQTEAGNPTSGREYFNAAVEKYHHAADSTEDTSYQAFCYYWAGNAYVQLGDYGNAVGNYDKAVGLDSSVSDYKTNLDYYRSYMSE